MPHLRHTIAGVIELGRDAGSNDRVLEACGIRVPARLRDTSPIESALISADLGQLSEDLQRELDLFLVRAAG